MQSIEFTGEDQGNEVRRRLTNIEPKALRTFTPTQAVLANSAGAYHWTPEGRKLADFSSGVLVANLGHNPGSWWKRVLEYLGLTNADLTAEYVPGPPLTAYNAVTDLEISASERLVKNLQAAPGGQRLEQVLWSASGSEAIQKAIWASFKYKPDADIILATRGGFHGKKGLAGAITGSESDSERDDRVRFISFPMDECCDVAARQEQLDLTKYANELEALKQEFGSRLNCLVTEPYLGGGGSFHPQPEYLQLLQQFCRDNDMVFVLDEIQSNFGRTGPMYAFTHYGVEPDIVCLGKGLGNGVPVSAAVGTTAILGALKYGEGSDTWSANPLSSAAVLATLDEFESTNVIEQGLALADVILQGLQRLKDTGVIVNVRGEGCVWGIECADIGSTPAADVANHCVSACYVGDSQGRAIHLLGPLAGKVLRVSPPLTMDIGEAQDYLDTMFDVFQQVHADLS